MDVKSAFLQGTPLNRYVYMEKELKSFGMKSISGDYAFFSMNKEGELQGMTVLHVDDFLVAGNQDFIRMIGQKFKKKFTFGKTELGQFKFTALNIEHTETGIYVDQIDYIHSIQSISSYRMDVHEDEALTKDEFRSYRALTGQLNWAAENTRPDIAFDVRFLATRNKSAQINDIKSANKILRRAQFEDVRIKYSKLGSWKNLKLVSYTDSSFKNSEDKVKSGGGRVSFLVNSL